MIKISTRLEYGLILLIYLAHNHSRFASLTKLARQAGLPLPYLSQIAARLVKAGVIRAKEGKNGGYQLNVNASSLTLGKIFTVLEGPLQLAPCSAQECSHNNCLIKGFWINLDNVLKKEFQRVKLKELI